MRLKTPDATLVIFSIIVIAAVMTWIVPPGAYDREERKNRQYTLVRPLLIVASVWP
jgi:uncharacterized ion transporter superfamily protein YfcC